MEKMSFAVACKRYFGLLPDQKVASFVAELKNLTKEDREEMAPQLGEELNAIVTVE